jgi:hypothetical protein
MTNREKNVVKMERMQQRIESGMVSEHFPGVSSIVIHVTNSYKGIIPETLLRTFNFWPNSYAHFDIECLSEECRDGGFDLNRIITVMIRNHKEAEEGELMCNSSNLSSDHSCIYYKVSILYDGTIL